MRAILTFHSVDNSGSVISYRPEHFAALIESLSSKKIPIYDLDTLLNNSQGPGVAITFDDGMRSIYQHALPVLKKHNAPAHLFLTTQPIENDTPWPAQPASIPSFDMLTWKQLEALHQAGVFIDSHTHTHPDMRRLSVSEMQDDCDTADDLITRKLGRKPEYFAYPYGFHNAAAREFVSKRYKGTVTVELRHLSSQESHATLPRLDSYYLQSDWAIQNIDTLLMTLYLKARSRLRALKGSQSDPGND
jgi:peptidoglycan/xylan/chitin deacetylase (PgdA/CDA1 family)